MQWKICCQSFKKNVIVRWESNFYCFDLINEEMFSDQVWKARVLFCLMIDANQQLVTWYNEF